ncbi:hypothetical protein AUQ39_03145 [Lacticaseibacillus casei]|nr:hypothetical protein AUQ39_03145 [Lacticaseibacillus casei]
MKSHKKAFLIYSISWAIMFVSALIWFTSKDGLTIDTLINSLGIATLGIILLAYGWFVLTYERK